VLEYQSDSSSHHDARPTVSRPGHGSVVSPVARSISIRLPESRPWSLAYPSTITARPRSGEIARPSVCHAGRYSVVAVRAARSRRATVAPYHPEPE
jgi:hypothetical protein